MARNKTIALIGTTLSLILIIFFAFSLAYRDSLRQLITGEATSYGYLFIIIISAFLEFIPQFIAPTWLMINAAVLNMPLIYVTIAIIFGSTIGSTLGFLVGREFGIDFLENMFGKNKLEKAKRLFNAHGKWFVALAALTPLPYLTLVFGALGMSTKNIIKFGLIPRAISYILLYLMILLGLNIF
ncbi:MAG: VTT domain-containing protein [Nanoarchaeota archaeon]|nr:VTT domain-containing protein [Nanoarchaeota archaeon]